MSKNENILLRSRLFVLVFVILVPVLQLDILCRNDQRIYHENLLTEKEILMLQEEQQYFIWKVTVNNNLFYLIGAVHLGRKTVYPLPSKYLECYGASDILIMELQEEFDEIEKQILLYAEKDKLSEDEYFRHHLDSITVDKISEIISREKFLVFDQYEGWLLNMIISGNRGKLAGYDPEYGIDKYFRELAESDAKKVIGLDSITEQIRLFDFELPYETQIKLLENNLKNIEISVSRETPLMDYYYNGDIHGFEQYFTGMYDFEDPGMKYSYDLVFTRRNVKWVDKLEEISRLDHHNTYMVLVGAGHFFGPDNLLELLGERNYVIECVD